MFVQKIAALIYQYASVRDTTFMLPENRISLKRKLADHKSFSEPDIPR